jgi:hypothetical protein
LVFAAFEEFSENDGEENTPIYPWPQVIVENTKNDGGEKYELNILVIRFYREK